MILSVGLERKVTASEKKSGMAISIVEST